VIEWATLSDKVGFLRGLRFSPTYITNHPILSVELYNNVLVDAQLSIQYFVYPLLSASVTVFHEHNSDFGSDSQGVLL
jgi:hypothetical protein